MTVASKLETCIVNLLGVQTDLLTQELASQDERIKETYRQASRGVADVVSELKGRLREIIREEPQYASSEGVLRPWDGIRR